MKRHTAEEVIVKLRQAEADLAQGLSIAQACQRLGVTGYPGSSAVRKNKATEAVAPEEPTAGAPPCGSHTDPT